MTHRIEYFTNYDADPPYGYTDHIAVCDGCGFEIINNHGHWSGSTDLTGSFIYPSGWTVEQQRTQISWKYPAYCPSCTAQRQPQPANPKRSI